MYYGYSYGLNYKSSGVAFDVDAQAFITAASITDLTQQEAVNQLVLDLKDASIWTKMKRIYPMVGGTADKHKYDLVTRAAGTFYGGWTHSANGSLANGTTGYFDTDFVPNGSISLNSGSFGLYVRNNAQGGWNGVETFGGGYLLLSPRRTDDTFKSLINSLYTPADVASTDSRGLFVANRTTSSTVKGWKNGVNVSTNAGSTTNGVPTHKIFFGAYSSQNTPTAYCPWEYAFCFVADGLTDQNNADLYTAVQAFQTTLSRNV
jgi:hypothetical protein